MARDNMAIGISKDWVGETERFDRRFDLIDLALRMGAGVTWIGNQVADCAVADSQPRRECNRGYIFHDR